MTAALALPLPGDVPQPSEGSFVVSGIHCAACSMTIEQRLLALPGVLEAEVNGASARARLRWDPLRSGPAAWAAALAPAGYTLAPDAAAPARALRRAEARTMTWRLFVAALCGMQVMMLAAPSYGSSPEEIGAELAQVLAWGQWVLSVPVMLFAAGPLLRAAAAGLAAKRLVMEVPVVLGIVVTFAAGTVATFDPTGPLGATVYFDSLTMFITLLLAARWLEMRLRHRAAEQLESAGALLPERALRLDDSGGVTAVDPAQLRVGEQVRVPQGEAVPADGELLEASAALDEALLSGESRTVPKAIGDRLWAGSLNRGQPLVMRVASAGAATRLAAIEALLRDAATRRPPSLRWADRWAPHFTAAVIGAALLAALAWSQIDPSRALEVAVAVLIVTCPCALALAVPLTQLAAAQRLAREGVVVQRLEGLEALATARRVMFDKTGTLTVHTTHAAIDRRPAAMLRVLAPGANAALLWRRAAMLGQASHHPLALAIAAAAPRDSSASALHSMAEEPGRGLRGIDADGHEWRLGSAHWTGATDDGQARAWLARDGIPLAAFDLAEALRPGAAEAVRALRSAGLALSLASGDSPKRVLALAATLGIDDVAAAASPEAKLARLAAAQRAGETVMAVGDGFNDGPLLAQADVAVALSHGAMATQRSAHLLLDSQRPGVLAALALARTVAQRARHIARQNLAWAALYNATCIPLALAGWLPPWAAGLGMATSSAAVLLNAARLNR